MTPCSRALLAAVVLAAATPASAVAAATWSDPVTIGPAVANADAPAAVFSAPGTALLSWAVATTEAPATRGPRPPDRSILASWRPDRAPVTATVHGDRVSTAVCGQRCLAVLREDDPARYDGRVVLHVSVGSGVTHLGAVTTLARYVQPEATAPSELDNSRPVIAASRIGTVAVAWAEAHNVVDGGARGSVLKIAVRAPGSRRWRVATVAGQARGFVRLPKLAFHGLHNLTVVYVRGRLVGGHLSRTVEARNVRADGRMRAPQTLGPAPQSYTDLQVATEAGGRTLVAWGNIHGTIMGQEDSWVVRAAIRRPSTLRFGAAQILDRGAVKAAGAPGTVRVGLGPGGHATVAWSAYVAGTPLPVPEIRFADAGAAGLFGAAQRLATGELRDMTFAGDAAVATWLGYGGTTAHLLAATRRSAAVGFDAPQVVGDIPLRSFNAIDADPAVALDPGTGRPIALWIADETANNLHVPMSTRLHLAIGPPTVGP